MKMRNVPVILKYVERIKAVPENIALGFAAYLLFLKPVKKKQDKYYGEWQGKEYVINDDYAAYFFEKWSKLSPAQVADAVLADSALWGADLTALPGFAEAVKNNLASLAETGVTKTIQINQTKKVLA
jgi:tagaturonate reductase